MNMLITLIPVGIVLTHHLVAEIRDARAASAGQPCRC